MTLLDALVVAVFVIWLGLNTQVILASIRITKIARRQTPPVPGTTLREWTRRGDVPADVDPELRTAIARMIRWRGMARRFFFVSAAAVLALIALNAMD